MSRRQQENPKTLRNARPVAGLQVWSRQPHLGSQVLCQQHSRLQVSAPLRQLLPQLGSARSGSIGRSSQGCGLLLQVADLPLQVLDAPLLRWGRAERACIH